MEDFSFELFEKLGKACNQCSSDTISLSGGLDSTIIAYYLKDKKPKSIAVVAKDFEASDLVFCQLVAKEFELPLSLLNVETSEILEAIENTILILKNFNDIEIRNNVVMYLALKWAKENGSGGIITGDGADELFAGYSFLINKNEEELEQELKRVFSVMHFPTQKIGESLGVKVESPFLNKEMIDLALQIPPTLKVKEHLGKKYGKWILRKTFEQKIPNKVVWRQKSPMQDGSGTCHLTKLFDNMITDADFVQKKEKIKDESDIKIRTKESMHYFEIFKNHFGIPKKALETGCPFCHSSTENSKFCRMCGAYPI